MSAELNISEKRCLDDFLKSVGDTKPPPIFSYLSSGAVSILGLILFTYAVTITLNNIPKWHIETWIAYLHGENVNEADKETYKKKYGKISVLKDVHPFINSLADYCRENMQLESPPNSLVAACEEFNRIRSVL